MADEFKGLNKETAEIAVSIKNSMREIGISTQALDKQLQKSKGYLIDINDEYKNITQSTNQVVKLQQEAQKNNKATEKAIIEQNKQLNISKTLNIQIDNLYEAALKSTGKIQENLFKQAKNLEAARDNSDKLANTFGNIAEDSSKLDKSTIWFGALSEVIKDIPGLRVFSKPFEQASEAARQQVINNAKIKAGATDLGKIQSSGIAGLTAGFKALGPVISSAFAPLAIFNTLVKIFNFFLDAMIAADKQVTNIAKNLSVSKTEAEGIYKNLTGLNLNSTLATTKNIAEAFNEIAQYSEITLIASNSQLKTQVELTKELGIASESALSLQESLMVSNIDAEKGVDLIYDQVAAFSNQNKVLVDGRKILEQVGKTSKLIQLNFKGNIPLLTKTILEANKLGLSLDQVDKIAGSLLDFESSISSELEAELLTGKQLNLEKARLYALNNDIAGLTEEIAKQGITAANFASMNRIQQEAIAKTLGMSSSELGDSLFKSERINKQAKETIRLLRERGAVEQANALEQGILSGKSLEDAQKSLDIQTKFNAAIERFQQIFSDVFTGERLDKMATYLEKLARALEGGQTLFSALAFGPNEDKKTAYARVSGGMGPKFATGGIVTKPITNATVGEAGPEAIVPLSTLMNEFREMKSLLSQLVNKEGVVYLDSSKVGTAMAMGTYKVQ